MDAEKNVLEIYDQLEKANEYWDEAGLDMHIAVIPFSTDYLNHKTKIAISTKHWARGYYINSSLSIQEVWLLIYQISQTIGRSLIKSKLGPYVYINKLNCEQTQAVIDLFKEKIGNDVYRAWEIKWDIEGAELPE